MWTLREPTRILGLNAKGKIVRSCSAVGLHPLILHPCLWAISSTFWRYTLAAGIGTCGDIQKRTQRDTLMGSPQDIRDSFRFQIPLPCKDVQSRLLCIWSPLGNPSPLTFLQSFFDFLSHHLLFRYRILNYTTYFPLNHHFQITFSLHSARCAAWSGGEIF